MIHFVGAGPGAVDLITVRGMRLLQEADVIIYAGSLVNPELLQYAKKDCQIFNSAIMTLEDVIKEIEKAEKEGKTTVRLHTGDPSIYGAIREQMDELEKREISFDVCPGVSSLFGAASSLQIEYTLPGVTQTVIISRGEGRTPVPEKEKLSLLATHQATMVLFLSCAFPEKIKEELLEGGYKEDTPLTVVYKATWNDEKIVETTIGTFPEALRQHNISKTALIIVGDVLEGTYERSKLYDPVFTTEFRKGTEE